MDEQEKITKETDGEGTVTRREVVRDTSAPTIGTVAARIVYLIFGFIITVLAIRMLLLLLAANQGNQFVDFVYGFSGVFAAPFYGIFSYEPQYGSFVFEVSTLVAIIVYALVGWGLASILTLGTKNRDTA